MDDFIRKYFRFMLTLNYYPFSSQAEYNINVVQVYGNGNAPVINVLDVDYVGITGKDLLCLFEVKGGNPWEEGYQVLYALF